MGEDKVTTKLLSVLRLPWLEEGSLHPYALECYVKFLKELYDEVPVNQLTDEDLTENEQAKRNESADGIRDWLIKCSKDAGAGALSVYPYSSVVNYYMRNLKIPLKAAYERKMEEAERQAREEAEEKKRQAAFEAIDPPVELAEKYLGGDEYQRFLDSIPGAISAFLSTDEKTKSYKANIWLLNSKASDYSHWILVIQGRRNKKIRQSKADLEYSQFLKKINDTIKKFKQELAKEKKPKFYYPPWLADYYPDVWCDLKLPTEKIEHWASPQIQERLPSTLRGFVAWDLDWQVQMLPEAKYEVLGVSSLTWCFTALVLVKAHLKLMEKTFTKEFDEYRYSTKVDAEELGCIYLGPALGGHWEGFSIPIALLSLLAKDEMEGSGIEVVNRGAPFTTFHVQGFEEETIEVHDTFRKFIRDIAKEQPLEEALLSKGLVDKDIVKLIVEKAKLPLSQLTTGQAINGPIIDDNSDVEAALEPMGYKKGEIKKALTAADLPHGLCVEEKVKLLLKNIGS